ncbi:MAG: endopeptidase La, partial [Elusimicrobia bacterium RIFCSPLOWO2_12_FULL_59_9]
MPEPSEQTSVTRLSTLPLIAVRDVVVFPHMSLPLSVGRVKSIRALEEAMSGPKMVLAVAQRDARVEDPQEKEVYHLGTLCEIVQYLKMPDGSLKVFLQGIVRAQADRLFFAADKNCWFAEVSYPSEAWKDSVELKVLVKQIHLAFEEYARIGRRVPQDLVLSLQQMMPSPSRFADTIAAHLNVPVPEKQKLLESAAIKARLEQILTLLKGEIEILNLEGKIHSRVRTQISKSQKEYYLNEQMKAIQKELRQKDDTAKEIDELRVKVKRAKMPKPAEEACDKEISRLEKMMPFSPEATVCRTYLDWMISLPWSRRTKDRIDLERARRILDEDHFGLKKAKERILEYLAVRKFTKRLKGPILCFVGPPGVGKTSLGLSIARALGREFVRMSLGGVRDEAEIRGHRRTYIGSLPGRVIKSMKRVKSKNPVFLLDEIDKMGVDWRGDPAAALLEVLDPEQNSTFVDHYLDTEFDLSEVLFICTANTLHGIPVSLQDRMEMIRFSGYTEMEKVFIVKKYLLPKLLVEHGLKRGQVKIDDAAIIRVIREYTQEAGVRNVQREAASLVRKGVKALVEKKKPS